VYFTLTFSCAAVAVGITQTGLQVAQQAAGLGQSVVTAAEAAASVATNLVTTGSSDIDINFTQPR